MDIILQENKVRNRKKVNLQRMLILEICCYLSDDVGDKRVVRMLKLCQKYLNRIQ